MRVLGFSAIVDSLKRGLLHRRWHLSCHLRCHLWLHLELLLVLMGRRISKLHAIVVMWPRKTGGLVVWHRGLTHHISRVVLLTNMRLPQGHRVAMHLLDWSQLEISLIILHMLSFLLSNCRSLRARCQLGCWVRLSIDFVAATLFIYERLLEAGLLLHLRGSCCSLVLL